MWYLISLILFLISNAELRPLDDNDIYHAKDIHDILRVLDPSCHNEILRHQDVTSGLFQCHITCYRQGNGVCRNECQCTWENKILDPNSNTINNQVPGSTKHENNKKNKENKKKPTPTKPVPKPKPISGTNVVELIFSDEDRLPDPEYNSAESKERKK
ncbi:uncharacterized protein LOC113366274 [Ctenocephalides felis]|uniref:uncharacterized protein LOC113366274 n=1 Tax=Ctenocephalides felis TaxID=7515 RepID=UPI000E6E28EE|nr:uncharacterized protein LOC113366274 [Ctenocephalides felis]